MVEFYLFILGMSGLLFDMGLRNQIKFGGHTYMYIVYNEVCHWDGHG